MPVYTLRGIGFYDTSLGSYPTTSVYVDQVPLPFPIVTSLTAFDLERIEVLKGPQGTLFGQNSTGGAINYIAARPTKDFHADVEASYGRFEDVFGTAFVSGPISDTLRARLAVRGEKSGPQAVPAIEEENVRLERRLADSAPRRDLPEAPSPQKGSLYEQNDDREQDQPLRRAAAVSIAEDRWRRAGTETDTPVGTGTARR